jgi:predicted transglutaminase-like cysteine proteinase
MEIWNKILILILLTACTPSIEQINRAVNKVPHVDGVYHNEHETRSFYAQGGNCWGYAAAKQYELEKAGYGRGQYQLVKYKGQMHVVLIYNNLILDSLTNELQPLEYLHTFDEIITPI